MSFPTQSTPRSSEFNASLHRQLRLPGLDHDKPELTPETWSTVLAWLRDRNHTLAEERRLLRESFEQEVRGLYRELAAERERASEVLTTATAALALLEDALCTGRERATFPAALSAVLEDLGTNDDRSAALGARFTRLGHRLHGMLAAASAAQVAAGAAAADLVRAGRLQRAWMPPEDVLTRGNIDLAGVCRSAGPCGGDFWTLRDLDDRRALLVVGDATGHGADAALITAVARGAIDVAVRARPTATAGELLATINDAIFSAGEQRVQMTCAAAILDVTDGRITAASAGHVLPYLLRANGTLDQIRAAGPALGSIAGASYADSAAALGLDDAVLWYTDGLIECEDHTGRQFGARRLRQLLSRLDGRAPEHICDAITSELARFSREAPAVDDLAFVAARFRRGRHRAASGWTRA